MFLRGRGLLAGLAGVVLGCVWVGWTLLLSTIVVVIGAGALEAALRALRLRVPGLAKKLVQVRTSPPLRWLVLSVWAVPLTVAPRGPGPLGWFSSSFITTVWDPPLIVVSIFGSSLAAATTQGAQECG